MIWILIFAFILTHSDSPFIIPHLDRYAGKHIVEKSRRKEMLDYLKKDKKQRKSFLKVQKQFMQDMNQLNYSRNSSRADFEKAFSKILEERRSLQEIDAQLKIKTAEYITEEEWELIKEDARKALNKTIVEMNERYLKFDAKYNKLVNEISSIIQDEDRRKKVLKSLKDFKEIIHSDFNSYEDRITDPKSPLYKHTVSADEMKILFKITNEWRIELFEAFVNNHFVILESTTPAEWELIVKKVKKIKY